MRPWATSSLSVVSEDFGAHALPAHDVEARAGFELEEDVVGACVGREADVGAGAELAGGLRRDVAVLAREARERSIISAR